MKNNATLSVRRLGIALTAATLSFAAATSAFADNGDGYVTVTEPHTTVIATDGLRQIINPTGYTDDRCFTYTISGSNGMSYEKDFFLRIKNMRKSPVYTLSWTPIANSYYTAGPITKFVVRSCSNAIGAPTLSINSGEAISIATAGVVNTDDNIYKNIELSNADGISSPISLKFGGIITATDGYINKLTFDYEVTYVQLDFSALDAAVADAQALLESLEGEADVADALPAIQAAIEAAEALKAQGNGKAYQEVEATPDDVAAAVSAIEAAVSAVPVPANYATAATYAVDKAAALGLDVSEYQQLLEGAQDGETVVGIFNDVTEAARQYAVDNYKLLNNGADLSIFIDNSSFERGNTEGWKLENTIEANRGGLYNGGNLTTNVADTQVHAFADDAAAPADGAYLFNTKNNMTLGNATGTSKVDFTTGQKLTQVITGLPNGTYRVSAFLATDADLEVSLLAGEGAFTVPGQGADTMVRVESDEIEVTDGTLTIGAIGQSKMVQTADIPVVGGHYERDYTTWFKADNFVLTLVKPTIVKVVRAVDALLQGEEGSVEENVNPIVDKILEK